MISITRLLELKKDLDLLRQERAEFGPSVYSTLTRHLGEYIDILEDYLRIQQGSA